MGLGVNCLTIALISIAALVTDYAQYIFGYLNTGRVLRKAEREKKPQVTYSR